MNVSRLSVLAGTAIGLIFLSAPASAHAMGAVTVVADLGRDQVSLSERADAPSIAVNNVQMPGMDRLQGTSGTDIVVITIDARGRVTRAELAASSGHPRLDAAALDGLRDSRFTPERIDGHAVGGSYLLDVDFTADGS